MQKINFFHLLSSDTSILESCNQHDHTNFWPCSPQKFSITFQFVWICASMQKISSFHLFILEIQLNLEPRDQIDHTHFLLCSTTRFSINLSFFWICINMQRIRLFHRFISWEMVDLKILRSDWDRFGLYLREQGFSQYRICAGTQQIIKFSL